MTPHALDKLERRARQSLRRATSKALKATTERAEKRGLRREHNARKALRRMEFDAFQWGSPAD